MNTNEEIIKTTESETSTTATKTSYISTSMTGLQDYSYWWKYARERGTSAEEGNKPFRRGRIWA